MVALVVSSLLIGMILSIFTRMSLAYRAQQNVAELQQTLAAWDTPDVDSPEIVHTEQRLANLIEALRGVAQGAPAGVDLADFRGKLESLALVLRDRDSRRAAAREKRMRDESYEQQDVLLSAARAHSLAGDLARAVESYEKLAEVDGSQKVMAILANESSIREVIAFPKTATAADMMSGAPSSVSAHQLRELHLRVSS